MNALSPAFQDVIRRFVLRLPEDRKRLVRLAEGIAAEADAALPEMRHIVHRLAGSAGTFGFAQLSRVALEFDNLLVGGCREVAPLRAQLEQVLNAIADAETGA